MIITDINQIHKLAFDMLWDGISSKIYFDDYRLIERYSQNVIAIYVEASNAQKCLNWFSAELKEITFDGATDVIVLYRGLACNSDCVLNKDSQINSNGEFKIKHQRKLFHSDEHRADNEVIFMVIGYGAKGGYLFLIDFRGCVTLFNKRTIKFKRYVDYNFTFDSCLYDYGQGC